MKTIHASSARRACCRLFGGARHVGSATALCAALLSSSPAHAAAIALGLGWTAETPAGVDLTDISVAADTIFFTKKATFSKFEAIAIVFTQDPANLDGKNETFFMVKEDITNMTNKAWNDFHMTIADANDNTSNSGAVHPIRAHFHPMAWEGNDPGTDYIAVNFPARNLGTYVMDLLLKTGHDPTAIGGKLTGQYVRMHDKLEANANRMQFTLTELPSAVPEPATWLLFGVGLLFMLGNGWRGRRSAA